MKRILISLHLLLSVLLSASQSHALNPYGFEQIMHIGNVYARSIVYDEETGLPLWATYNEDGGHTKLSGFSLELAYEGRVVSGENYRAYTKAYEDFKIQYEGKVDLLTTEEFKEQAGDGILTSKDGQPIENWNANNLGNDVLSVAIPSKEKRLQFDANQIEKLYLPVNLKVLPSVGEDIKSVLIDIEGNKLVDSSDRIGKLSAFYVEEGGEVEDATEYEYSSSIKRLHDYDILDPVSGVLIEGVTGYLNGATTSNESGSYRLLTRPSPCPGFMYQPELTATARLYYANFNPKGSPAIPYYIDKKSYNSCNGIYMFLAGIPDLGAQMAALQILAIVSAAPENITTLNYPIAINVLAGNAVLKGAAISETEPTAYDAEESPMTETIIYKDYDGDNVIDGAVRGDFDDDGIFTPSEDSENYGVYLSASLRVDGQPNFTRVMDTLQDVKHKGLVKTINKDDLMETDILVFRESTGQLITERSGLSEEDLERSKVIGRLQQDENGDFSYTIAIRSTEDSAATRRTWIDTGTWQNWQSLNQMNPELHDHQSDFIRNGEQLRIIAINRATGYIGTVITELTGPKDGGDVTVPIKPIIMGPPNLKVWATRTYEPEGLLGSDDERRNTISNEGAATTDDFLIEIHTKWLDANGLPLPAGLEERGYTGRLVKVSTDPANTTDPYSTQASEFSIDPGTQLQVVKFGEGEAEKYHYYLQVNAKTGAEQNDFSTGNHSGVLRHRPNKYVPVLVPLYNEDATNLNIMTHRQHEEETDEEVDYRDLKSSFDWVYRPELSFSVVDLEIESMVRVIDDEESGNILEDDTPIISSSDDSIKFLFDLLTSQYDRITPLDGEQTYILALGEEEIAIEITEGKNSEREISFINLDHLASLEVEDFLTARLYLNQDSNNALWEFAFDLLYVESAKVGHNLQTENAFYVTADDPVVELKAGIAGYSYLDDGDKYKPVIDWTLEGDGNLAERVQSNPTDALFDNTLTMPTVKGASADLTVKIRDTQAETKWKTVKVLAGSPDRIEIEETGKAASLDQGDVTLNFMVYDKFGNTVEDGTDIIVDYSDTLRVKNQNLSSVNGAGFITFYGGEFTSINSSLTITVDDIEKTHKLSVEALNIAIEAEATQLSKLQTIKFTATVTTLSGAPAINVPVSLGSGKGVFASQNLITDSEGKVHTTFTAGLNEVDDKWTAMAGFVATAELPYTIKNSGAKNIEAADAMLVADELYDGTLEFDSYDVPVQLGYETHGQLNIRGAAGDVLSIGDMADPNLEPLISLPLNQIDQLKVLDDLQLNNGTVSGISIVNDHPLGAGRSADFATGSRVNVASNALFALGNNLGFRLDIKPKGNGDVVNYGGGNLSLKYENGVMSTHLETTEGPISVSAFGVALDKWHTVATKVVDKKLYLYVDGLTYSQDFIGDLVDASFSDPDSAIADDSIEIGGLNARMRGFKVFDYSSDPLISFENGQSQYTLSAAEESVIVVSLGKLGKRVTQSKLLSHRVVVMAGQERNYVSLLTKAGYQKFATDYLYSVSPQTPIAYMHAPNPIPGLVTTAHAWTWDGVWDGVKDTVGMLIPYEDFIVIADQLTYLVNQDWENFDPTALAFASLGAATILPPAKVLKPLLPPIKRFVTAMKRFPGARHFAGAVGTAVKSGLGGNTSKLENLLPFVLLGVEIYNDQEVFEFMMSTIESEDDLWMWVDYAATLISVNGGLISDDIVASNISLPSALSIVPVAYAASAGKSRKENALDFIDAIKPVAKKFVGKGTKEFTTGMKALLKEFKDPANSRFVGVIKSGSALRYLTTLARAKLAKFFSQSKNWRVNRWVVLASLVYLTDEITEGDLQHIDKEKWAALSADVFSGWAWRQHGAIFQVSQMAMFHLQHKYADGPKIKDIEATRAAYRVVNGKVPNGAKPYRRRIDIVLEESGEEEWVELKSLSGPYENGWFAPKLAGVSKADETQSGFNAKEDRSYFRQFFHDMRMNADFISDDYKSRIIGDQASNGATTNDKYQWYFQGYTTGSTSSKPPTAADAKKIIRLCNVPSDVRPKKEFYDNNLSGSSTEMKNLCINNSDRIAIRDTKSYFSDLLETYAGNLDIQDLVDVINELGIVN